jgi:putative FmdB family regulatory protein
MPIYVFECQSCKRREERVQVFYEPVIPPCEECGTWMKLLINAAPVIYKGEGFAKKDRRAGK